MIFLYAVRLGAPLESDPTRRCELLVGKPDVTVLGVDDTGDRVTVMIETRGPRPLCLGGGAVPKIKDRDPVLLVDLPVFGRRSRLLWRKHRWRCDATSCAVNTSKLTVPEIAPSRLALTDRAGRCVRAWSACIAGR